MRQSDGWFVLAAPVRTAQYSADTMARTEMRGGAMHYRHGWWGIVHLAIWLAVLIYVLILATRVVRAVEKMADKFQSRGP